MIRVKLVLIILIAVNNIAISQQENYWIPCNRGIENYKITSIAINQNGIILAQRESFDLNRETIYVPTLFRSKDGGATWQDIGQNIPSFYEIGKNKTLIGIFAIKNSFFAKLWVGTKPHARGYIVIKSDDGGQSWTDVSKHLGYCPLLEFAHSDDGTIYLLQGQLNENRTLWRSMNNGMTWEKLYHGSPMLSHHLSNLYAGNDGLLMATMTSFTSENIGSAYGFNFKTSDWVRYDSDPDFILEKEKYNLNGRLSTFRTNIVGLSGSNRLFTSFEFSRRYSDQLLTSTAISFNSHELDGKLFSSDDNGRTWTHISDNNFFVSDIHHVNQNGSIFVSAVPGNSNGKINDALTSFLVRQNGKNWIALLGLPSRIRAFAEHPNGIYFVGTERGVYKSSKALEPKISYGTTIITHGYQSGNIAPIVKGQWAYDMAEAVLDKAQHGAIYSYEKSTGNYLKIKELGNFKKGEKILLFDWASESNNIAQGYTEAAGDALFASLLIGYKNSQFGLDSIHFIGHSRGTVVNTLAVERLLTLKQNYLEYKSKISIDQVTNISPHDWGLSISIEDLPITQNYFDKQQYVLGMDDLDDAHPDFEIEEPKDYRPNNGTIAWKGIFSDTYWQEHGKFIEKKTWEKRLSIWDFVGLADKIKDKKWLGAVWESIKLYVNTNFHTEYINLNDRPITGSHNTLWPEDEKGQYTLHSGERGVYNIYIKTINGMPPLYGSGYQFSRLAGKILSRPATGYGLKTPTFNFYDNMISIDKKINRTLGICNGSFDRYDVPSVPQSDLVIAPGWVEHGGGQFFSPGDGVIAEEPFSFSEEGIRLKYYWHFKKPMSLIHNRFYIPIDAKSITFKLKSHNLKQGLLKIYLTNHNTTSGPKLRIPIFEETIHANINDFVDKSFDISRFKDCVATLEFEYQGLPLQNHDLPILTLDEVKLSKQSVSQVTTNNSKTHTPIAKPVPTETQIIQHDQRTDPIIDDTISFHNPENWHYTTGSVLLKNGMASLKLPNKNVAIQLTQENYTVPKSAKGVQFSIRTLNVQNGSLVIKIKDNETGKISSKVVNIPFDILRPKSEYIDLSAFSGKKISLNFEFKGDSINKDFLAGLEILSIQVLKD